MGWKERAIPVTQAAPASSWRSRAVPVNVPDQEPQQASQENDNNQVEQALNDAANSTIGRGLLGAASAAGKFVDSYTGAPARAAIGAAQDGENPFKAGWAQFGEDPEKAPTGKQIAQKAGVPDANISQYVPSLYSDTGKEWLKFKRGGFMDPTLSGAAGLGIDVVADPTIAAGPALKGASRGAELIGKGAKAIGLGDEAAAIAKKTSGLVKGIESAPVKVGGELTGIPEKEIETYSKHTGDVDKLIEQHGGDIEGAAATATKENMGRAIQAAKQEANQTISKALESAPKDKVIDVQPILDELAKHQQRLNSVLKGDAKEEIQALANKIADFAPDGKISVQELHELKSYLQESAKSSYPKGGQIFVRGKESAQAAKAAGAKAKKLFDSVAPSEAVEANSKLQKLHLIEDTMNKNLLDPNKSSAALMAAGSGTNNLAQRQLKALGDVTGKDMVLEAQKLAAAKRFAKPGLLPVDSTGKSLTRMGVGAVGGYLMGGTPGLVIGGALTSPRAVKAGIKAKSILNTAKILGKARKAAQVYSVDDRDDEDQPGQSPAINFGKNNK